MLSLGQHRNRIHLSDSKYLQADEVIINVSSGSPSFTIILGFFTDRLVVRRRNFIGLGTRGGRSKLASVMRFAGFQ